MRVRDQQRRYLRLPSLNLKSEVEPIRSSPSVADAKGKLGVMIPGMGAVATTFVAGVEAVRQGIALPIGSMTQMGTVRLGKRTEGRSPKINEFVPLAQLQDLVFSGWDIFEADMYEAASNARVLETSLLAKVKPCLQAIKPLSAVFDQHYVKRLSGRNVKKGRNKMDLAQHVRSDIYEFKKSSGADRMVMIWCGSTEIFLKQSEVHETIRAFETGLERNDENISPSMIYAYAALCEDVPFANGAPNLTVDLPALQELSRRNHAPIWGKDSCQSSTSQDNGRILKTHGISRMETLLLGVGVLSLRQVSASSDRGWLAC